MSIFKKVITSNLSRGATHSMRCLSTWSTTPLHSNLLFQPRNPMPQVFSPNPTSLEQISLFKKSITSNLSHGATHSMRRLCTWTTPNHTYLLFEPRFPMPQVISPPCPTSSEDYRFLYYVNHYTESLRMHSVYGVPCTWSDALRSFDRSHRGHLYVIQNWTSYEIKTLITPKEYMLLYLRCTLADIPNILMYLRKRKIGVALEVPEKFPRYSPDTNFIRLSGLTVANDPCMILRTDASYLSGSAGYGHVLSDSADNCVGYGYGPIANIPAGVVGLSFKELVTVVELHAIRQALEEFHKYSQEAQLPIIPKIRILSDSSNAINILHGKPVISNMAEALPSISKYNHYVLDVMCAIGIELKPLHDYCANHIYRNVNDDSDFLARMGRLGIHPSIEEIMSCGESEILRIY